MGLSSNTSYLLKLTLVTTLGVDWADIVSHLQRIKVSITIIIANPFMS